MFTFNIDNKDQYKNIHFIGIGGISMSGIALLLHESGFTISGSDRQANPHTIILENKGIKVTYEQKAENIDNPDLVVYTDAILPENPELIAAKNLNVPVVTRGVFLGALMRNYTHAIAISGSHGKSTVTSMISTVMVNTEHNPTILLGGDLDEISGNTLVGERDYLITEACEYKGNILNFFPTTAIVLNISPDHLDYFKDLNHIIDTFIGYMKNLDENDNAIINIDDENCLHLIEHVKGNVYTFGMDNDKADYNIKNIVHDEIGRPNFDIFCPDGSILNLSLNVVGDFNIYNATATAIALLETGVSPELIISRLKSYKPLHRRMELVGTYNNANVLTDYGHHPIEIKNTLDALAAHKKGKLICVFQPHTYSRTKSLLEEFSHAFYSADEVVVTEIYAARENFDPTIKSEDLVEKLVANGVNAKYIKDFPETCAYIQNRLEENDTVITTGCGNPHLLAYMIAGVEEKAV